MTRPGAGLGPGSGGRGEGEAVVRAGEPVPAALRRHMPASAGYVVLTAGFFWPILPRFGTHVLSAGGDGSTFIWAWWYMPRAAARFDNPFVTTDLFHPVGANLAFHTSTPLQMVATWPVAQLFGLGVAVNVLQLAAVVLSAFGAYALALRVCGDRRAAFFAGAAFAFVPYRFVHVSGHLNLIHVEFLPFGLLALLRLLERPTRGRGAVLGAMVGLAFLTDFYLTVFLVLAMAVLLVARRGESPLPVVGPALAVAAVVAGTLALPLVVPMAQAVWAGELDALPGWGGADLYSADLVSWFLPPDSHPWWGRAAAGARGGLIAGGEGLAYPGMVVLGLAVAGRRLGDRARRRGWVALAATAAVLALGPFLQIGGRTGDLFEYLGRRFSLPLPYAALHFVPVVNGVRVPGRFAILAILALDVLAALTLSSLARTKPRHAPALVAAAFAVTMVEFLRGPLAMHPVAVPEPYHAIARDPDPGAVLEVPLQWLSGVSAVGDTHPPRVNVIFMYYATVHGKPLVSGYVSRLAQRRLDELTNIPVYRQVLSLADEPGFEDPATFTAADLRRLGIGFVVYHRDRPKPGVHEYLTRLGLEPIADDGTIVAWKVP